jgi:hypothetical protein
MSENNLRVMVVSIGRSGTSLFARILDQVLGVDFGAERDHIPRNHNNPDGYFENAEFMAFNDRVLQAADGWVLAPPAVDYPARLTAATMDAFASDARTLLAKYSAGKPTFGWKDPRISLTLPVWRAACPDVVPIIAFRKPPSVLSSISAQLGRPVDALAYLWLSYYERIFAYTQGMPRYVVSYDDLLRDPTPVVMGIATHLGLTVDESDVRAKLAEIVKPQQSRHSSAEMAAKCADLLDAKTLSLYEYLCDAVANGGQPDFARIDKILAAH